MGYYSEQYEQTVKDILGEIERALLTVDPDSIESFVREILSAEKVFFIGVGRVMLSLSAFAKRLAHLGISAHCVGDITEPAITEKDLLIVGSGSGSTIFPLGIVKKAKGLGARVAHIGSNPNSPMAEYEDLLVRIPVRTKEYRDDEIDSLQPMTSLFEQSLLILGDTVAKMIVDERQIDMKELWQYHANLE